MSSYFKMIKKYKLLIAYGNDPGINLGFLKGKKNEEISIDPTYGIKRNGENKLEGALFDSIYERCLDKDKPNVAIIQGNKLDSLKVKAYFAPEMTPFHPERLFNKKLKLYLHLNNGYIVVKSDTFKK